MAAIDEEVEGTSICVSALMRDKPVSRAESVDDAWRNGADDEADAMVRNQPPEKKNEIEIEKEEEGEKGGGRRGKTLARVRILPF